MTQIALFKNFWPYKITGLKRLGNKYDGGYIVHEPSLKDIDVLVTYGVGYNVEFEKAFNAVTKASVLAFDPTMKDIDFLKNKLREQGVIATLKQLRWLCKWLRSEKSLFKHKINFIQEGISDEDDSNYKTYATHIKEHLLTDKKLMLKIDVDGAEYPVFSGLEIYKLLDNVIQLIIEFHDLDKNISEVSEIIGKLSHTHTLIHIHGNNYGHPFLLEGKQIPNVIETTFIHNSLLTKKVLSDSDYPIENLDSPCDKSRPDLKLIFFK